MEQITLNFDASEFEGFERTQEFFAWNTKNLKDDQGRTIKQAVQAMEMDLSPSQWSQKVHQSNNTTITLNDADKYTELFGDTQWIYFALYKHVISKSNDIDELLKLKADLERKIQQATGAK